MTNSVRSMLWATLGPIASCVAGFAAFGVLVFVVGPGFDIDNSGTVTQKLFASAALPVLGVIAGGGSVLSLVIAVITFRQR